MAGRGIPVREIRMIVWSGAVLQVPTLWLYRNSVQGNTSMWLLYIGTRDIELHSETMLKLTKEMIHLPMGK